MRLFHVAPGAIVGRYAANCFAVGPSSFAELQDLAEIAPAYLELRRQHPLIPARRIHAYLRSDQSETFEVFMCPGHEWVYTGTAYGGDDERWHGEGRCYCSHCGADGDA